MAVSLTPDQVLSLRSLCSQLAQAAKGQKAALKESMARQFNCSLATLHRYLKQVGYSDGRKTRADKGSSCVSAEDARVMGATLFVATRKNGKRTLCIEDGAEMMRENGKIVAGRVDKETGEIVPAHPSTISRAMRKHAMHPDQLSAPAPHMPLRYPYPNHTWEIDASVCVVFYLDDDGARLMDEAVFYKNKPENLKRIEAQRVIRYVMWDGHSGSVLARYYLGAETSENLIDFFIWCTQQRFHDGEGMPVFGVPFTLKDDAGSSNRGYLFESFLQALDVRHITHMPGNPRATGGVERSQNTVETKFESKLTFCVTDNLDELNARALKWMHGFNSLREHTRTGHTRYALWNTIRAEHLRIAPDEAIMRALPTSKVETRTVEGDLTVSYAPARLKGARYDVSAVPGVYVSGKVAVSLNPYERDARGVQFIRARAIDTGEETWTSCPPLEIGIDGVRVDAAISGEGFNPLPDTIVDTNRKALMKDAYGTDTLRDARKAKYGRTPAFLGEIDPFAAEAKALLPSYLPKRGTQLNVPSPVQLEMKPYTHLETMKWVVGRIGRGITAEENALVRTTWPQGVPQDELESVLARLQGMEETAPVAAAGGLRLV